MRRGTVLATILASGLMLVLGVGIYAQVKTDPKTGLDRIEGMVRDLDKAKCTFTVTQTGATGVTWKVAYNDQTKFTTRNEPAKLEDLKDGLRVIVLGKYADKLLTATRVDVRTEK